MNYHTNGAPIRAGGRVRYAWRPVATRAVARQLVATARPPARIDGAVTPQVHGERRPSGGSET
jgi:hypothetical protein